MGRVFSRELASVIATVALAGMAMSVLQPILPLYLNDLGISASTIGLMFSLAMFGMVFGEPAGGWLADKIGIRIPLGIGTLIAGPVVLLFLISANVPFIFSVFLVWGVVRAGIFGPGRGYIGYNVPLGYRATWLAIYSAAMSVTRSLGSFIGGLVAERLGYDWNFYFAAAIAVLGGLLVVFALKRIPVINPAAPPVPAPSQNAVPAKAPYRSRSFIVQCSLGLLFWVSAGAMGPFIPLLAVETVGVKETEVGLLFTISALVGAAMLMVTGRLSDRLNKKALIIIGLLVSAAGMASIGYAGTYGFIIAAMLLQAAGAALFGPAAVALLSQTVPRYWQNTAMGLYGGCEDIGVVIGSAFGGFFWDAFGPHATFLFTGAATSVVAAVIAFALLSNRPAPAPAD